jgi:hypothetical protein
MSKWSNPTLIKNPEVKRIVSPGRKKPISKPDSAKMIAATTAITIQGPAVEAKLVKSNPGIISVSF